ncbi:MAG: hypothetical protein ACWGO1_05905 [Anaerolineales bacterium]
MALSLLACQAVSSLFGASPSPFPPASLLATEPPNTFPTLTISPSQPAATWTAAPLPSSTPSPFPSPSPKPTFEVQGWESPDLSPATYSLRLHPDGGLYVGDQVSFEVIAPQGAEVDEQQALVALTGSNPRELGSADFESYGIADRQQATLYWAWDTAGLAPKDYTLAYSIQPAGLVFSQTVTLQPADMIPPPEPQAHWASTQSECCTIHYITGTAAERDLQELTEIIDEQAADVSRLLGADFDEPVSVVLLSRVLGHGGFTSEEIYVSYLDRNYAGSSPQIVLHHELVHKLDSQLGGELRPTLLVEGLAVYLSGGHFKPEPLMPRAAAVLDLGRYIPLEQLADEFYPAQHEIGYLQAGALVQFMVEQWGWQVFSDFYRDIQPVPDDAPGAGRQSQAIDIALQEKFGMSFADLERDFIQALRREVVTEELRQDVRLGVKLYEMVRAYQIALDPSAYFMTAWLPDGQQMRERGIVADYLRHPDSFMNVILEMWLVDADQYLRSGLYAEADEYLSYVEQVLANDLPEARSAKRQDWVWQESQSGLLPSYMQDGCSIANLPIMDRRGLPSAGW